MSAPKKKVQKKGAPVEAREPEAPPVVASGSTSWLGLWAFGPVAAVRPYLAMRAVLWILAVDVWSTHLGAAWRYGTAGFNVAHFGWMDALLPIPTGVAYVGMLALVSAGAAAAASMQRPPRALVLGVALLYLWGWSSSMHDSYQHHYMLSWVLLTFVAVPWHGASELFGPPSRGRTAEGTGWLASAGFSTLPHGPIPRTHAWGPRLVTLLPAVVYAYTAVSKLEPEWRSGDALRSLTHGGEGMEPMFDLLARFGLSSDDAWPFLGATTIGIQVVVSCAYLLAPLSDLDISEEKSAVRGRAIGFLFGVAAPLVIGGLLLVTRLDVGQRLSGGALLGGLVLLGLAGRALGNERAPGTALLTGVARGVGTVGLFAAIAFHLGAEHMGLEIGWFSYYMIALALVFFLPAQWVGAVVAVVTAIPREIEATLRERPWGPVADLGVAMVGAMALAWLGDVARVPGAFGALVLAGGVLLALGVLGMMRPPLRRFGVEAACGAIVVAALASYSLQHTAERFDYFRFAGGDFRRRNEVQAALSAYREALDLAPAEERARIEGRIEELEALTP